MTDPNSQTVWITKYALTKGVFQVQVTQPAVEGKASYVVVVKDGYRTLYHAPDFHFTKEEADRRVLLMIETARKRIERKLAKLRKIEDGIIK